MLTLLIVARAADLADSLRFVLEAENYDVTAATSLAEASAIATRFDCTVLDHHVLKDEDSAVAFMRSHRPVVLLANDLGHPLMSWSFRTLTKPLLGAALSLAVRDAVASRLH